jgi:ATP-dependent exoDNAse (exonuclease V) beta subunit
LDLAGETTVWRDGTGVVWRTLAPPGEVEPPPAEPPQATPPDPDAALATLAQARAAAAGRQAAPRVARVTELATLAAEAAAGGDEADVVPASAAAATGEIDAVRRLALARGTALHRALELAPVAAEDPARWRAAAAATFDLALGGATETERRGLDGDLDRLLASRLFARLATLAPRILAREAPFVAAAGPADPPLDAVTGAADLIYRDERGEPVLADFKSDAVTDDEAARLAAAYAPQLDRYARAVADALGLATPPRRELWLLTLDRVLPLDGESV